VQGEGVAVAAACDERAHDRVGRVLHGGAVALVPGKAPVAGEVKLAHRSPFYDDRYRTLGYSGRHNKEGVMSVDVRQQIVAGAADLIRRRGLAGTSIRGLAQHAAAPLGSTYHYFPGGKQQLAAEVVRASGAYFQALVLAVYDVQTTTADAVWSVFAGAAETLEETDYVDACPIATVALEVASTDEVLRQATAEVFSSWTEALTERLDGDRDRALAIIAALEGAFVLSRALRSTEPMYAAGRLAVAGL
jgi:AcrR family transcriptional regulator